MQSNYTVLLLLLILFPSTFILHSSDFVAMVKAKLQAHDEKYPQDALTNTWIPVDTTKIGLKEMRSAIRDKVDEQTNAKIAVDKCKSLLDSGKVDIAALYKRLSKVIQNSHHTSDKGTLLALGTYKAKFGTIIGAIDSTGMSVAFTVAGDDICKINRLVNSLKSGAFENMPFYNDVYNRLSRSIKKGEEFRYSLAEAEVLGQDVPELSEWYTSNQKIIQKIKSNTVAKKELSISNKWHEEIMYCAQDCPTEVLAIITAIISRKKVEEYTRENPARKYDLFNHDNMLRYPQDSFDGLSPHVEYHRSPYVTLLQPTLDGKMLYPAKQVWFGSGYVRLSDDYNCVDISCSVRTVTKLLSVELCHNYLIGLYEAYNAGWAKLVVFKLPTAKRRYEKTEQSIQVKAYSDKDTNVVFETEEMQSVQLVGIDKISEQIFYNIGNQLYQCPLCLPDPRKVTTPDNLEFKKIVSPSCFISLFLTHDGDVWYRTHKISKDVSDAFNYQWGRLEFLRDIENIAIERWPELGKFGLALMTHDGALLCECCPDEEVPFIVWSKTANPQRFYQLEEGERSERLYLHNKEVTLLKSGPEWVQVPIAWS